MKTAVILSFLAVIVIATALESDSEAGAANLGEVEISGEIRDKREADKKRQRQHRRNKKRTNKKRKSNKKRRGNKKGHKKSNRPRQNEDSNLFCPPVPAPTPCPTQSCDADWVTGLKEYKKASNWLRQLNRVVKTLRKIENKKGKADNFDNGAMALGSATMDGTSCAGGAPNATANAAWTTLKNCSTAISAECVCNATTPDTATCKTKLMAVIDATDVSTKRTVPIFNM